MSLDLSGALAKLASFGPDPTLVQLQSLVSEISVTAPGASRKPNRRVPTYAGVQAVRKYGARLTHLPGTLTQKHYTIER